MVLFDCNEFYRELFTLFSLVIDVNIQTGFDMTAKLILLDLNIKILISGSLKLLFNSIIVHLTKKTQISASRWRQMKSQRIPKMSRVYPLGSVQYVIATH